MTRSLAAALAALALAACDTREPPRTAGAYSPVPGVRQSDLQPGVPQQQVSMINPYEGNAYATAHGERLYNWYNCSGCHFNGGGGIGPPLMDEEWIYGDETQNILDSIMEGRPEGMPSYRGKMPHDDAMKIIAFVRSLAKKGRELEGYQRKREDTGVERRDEIREKQEQRRLDDNGT